MSIPKIIHMSWVCKDITHSQNPMILNGLRNLIDMNPDWTIEINTDQEVNQYLRENLAVRDFKDIENRPFVEKSDLWRLFKIRNHGGIYIDLDRLYNQPLNQVLKPNVKCVLPTTGDFDFSQDLMISEPDFPLFQQVIDLNLTRRRAGHRNIYYLGPQTYMNAITGWLLGTEIQPDPGSKVFDHIRSVINAHPDLDTYKEDGPDYTMIYSYDPKTYKQGNGQSKKDFYRDHNVTHWLE